MKTDDKPIADPFTDFPIPPPINKEEEKETAYQYAKIYHLTRTKSDFLSAIKKHMPAPDLKIASIVWESIDQYEAEVDPR